MIAQQAAPDAALVDAQGRQIVYLRLSLTGQCNFRCSYCAPPSADRAAGTGLARDQLARVVRVFAGLGIRRVRLTGGEPTLRADVLAIVRDVSATPGIEEIALTTNGTLLADLAGPLRAAGVSRLNVSLDTLHAEKLKRIAGRAASLERIVRGIRAASAAGFASMKLNVVVARGMNEDELGDLARFAWSVGATPRFIELMPFGPGRPVPTAEVKALLASQGVMLEPDGSRGWGPAHYMRGASEHAGERASGLVGFIGALTENFCWACNRVRIGADGSLRACLGGRVRVPLAALMAGGASDAQLAACIRAALAAKPDRHHMQEGSDSLFPMIEMGG